jgi:hypothetical protein
LAWCPANLEVDGEEGLASLVALQRLQRPYVIRIIRLRGAMIIWVLRVILIIRVNRAVDLNSYVCMCVSV